MKTLVCVALFACYFASVFATVGVDVSASVSVSAWGCLRKPGGQGAVTFAIPRVYMSYGAVDSVGIQVVMSIKLFDEPLLTLPSRCVF
jgi:hypothetical protein